MQSKMVLVTPEIAEKTLSNNTRNRNINWNHVRELAAAMTDGTWMETGTPIKLGPNNILVNGQHTLHAIIMSGKAQMMNVVYGVEEAVKYVEDRPLKRTAAHDIQSDGNKCTASTAAALKCLYSLLMGDTAPKFEGKIASDLFMSIGPEMAHSVNESKKLCKAGKIKCPSHFSVAHFLFSRKYGGDAADSFFMQIFSGVRIAPGTPSQSLHHELRDGKAAFGSIEHKATIMRMIRAYNRPNNRLTVDAETGTEYDRMISELPKSVLRLAGYSK